MNPKKKLILLQFGIHVLNYLIILYLFIKSHISGNLAIKDIYFSLIGFSTSFLVFLYIEIRINKSI